MTIFFLITAAVCLTLGFLAGLTLRKYDAIEISDTFTPNKTRSEKQQRHDAVMLLKDEIAKSEALNITPLENGKVEVSLMLIQ
ncbi:MAG: hypothetical protein LBE36_06335 [Flavobacteriaceae bacterium]|nr:hypothetical protein [Flavobacteriaceae bacterium]